MTFEAACARIAQTMEEIGQEMDMDPAMVWQMTALTDAAAALEALRSYTAIPGRQRATTPAGRGSAMTKREVGDYMGWNHIYRPGQFTELGAPWFAELLEGQASRELFRTQWGPGRAPHTNAGEMGARRIVRKLRSRRPKLHDTRQILCVDSRVGLCASAKGRASRKAKGPRRESRFMLGQKVCCGRTPPGTWRTAHQRSAAGLP